ncbi:dynein axonemal intermediate chain 3 isoform X2 [Cloeon dipterum]|uniref:dynein axonemal intermediate chain 3 isoform X2 n=1 Tax=Cloeon dipterum TaxID=197152 RepID=UPI00321F734A
MEQTEETARVARVQLSHALRSALGLTEGKVAKFFKTHHLAQELNLVALQTCKNEIVFAKVETIDGEDQLRIFLSEDEIERETCKEAACTDNVLEEESAKMSAVKSWSGQGSDAEIIQSHAPNQRPLLAVEAEISRRKRRKAGDLSRYDAKVASFHASTEEVQVIEKKFMDTCTQAGESVDAEAQTVINFPKHVWTQWSPQQRDFDFTHEEKTHLEEWVQQKADLVLDCAHHNCILENHVDDFQQLTMSDELETIFRNESSNEYSLSDIISSFCYCQGVIIAYAWHPSRKHLMATSYGDEVKFSPMEQESSVCDELSEVVQKLSSLFVEKVLIWDCDAKKPKFSLTSSSLVVCLLFCPADESLLFGGCCNGTVVIWKLDFTKDTSKIIHADPTLQNKSSSSRKAIIGIHWLEENNFITISEEGLIVVWTLEADAIIRESGVLYSVKSKNLFIATASCLAEMKSKTKDRIFKILVGSQGGIISVFEIDIQPKIISDDEELEESSKISYLDPSKSPTMHDGPVVDIKAAPLEKNIFLSVGGHIFTIFSLANENCPLFLKKGSEPLSSCAWSCYSKNIFYVCTAAGKLQVWNLLNAKSNLETEFCFTPGYIRDLSSTTSALRSGLLHLSDDRGSIMLCQIPEIHRLENKAAVNIFSGELARVSQLDSISLPAPEESSALNEEVKKRQAMLQKDEDRLNAKMASLVKPERTEVAALREKQGSRDLATRLEATRRLQLLHHLPEKLLSLKSVDMQRLAEFQQPMLHLQRRDRRRSILRESGLRADGDL